MFIFMKAYLQWRFQPSLEGVIFFNTLVFYYYIFINILKIENGNKNYDLLHSKTNNYSSYFGNGSSRPLQIRPCVFYNQDDGLVVKGVFKFFQVEASTPHLYWSMDVLCFVYTKWSGVWMPYRCSCMWVAVTEVSLRQKPLKIAVCISSFI